MSGEEASVESIVADLHRLGVDDGDVVMVHASLKAIGPVEGGADGIIAALDTAVGARGSILMVLSARDDWDWVNDRPRDERPGLLTDSPPFDHRTTPADPDVGVLAEVFRRHPDTFTNDHPEGRFGARGFQAHELIDNPPWDDYFGNGSPLERLVGTQGRVLRLGADPDTVTLLHYAEYLANIPHKRRVTRYRKVLDGAGPALKTVSSLDDSEGIVDYPGGDYFIDILNAFLKTGRARTGRVGGAHSELLEAAELVEFATRWMNRHLA